MMDVLRIRGFSAFILVAFLNAFLDLGHKIMIQNTIFKIYDGQTQIILTAIVNALILLPFIMVFTPAGFLSDKYPKNRIMRLSALAAFVLVLLIVLSYYMGWFWFGFSMTFLLALQSAIYGPAKLGYIRELVGEMHLSQGNALAQSVVMVSILLSTFVFSLLFESRLADMVYAGKADILQLIAPLGWLLLLISALEVFFAYRLPDTGQSNPELVFDRHEYLHGRTGRENVLMVWNNQTIWLSIIGVSIFWALSQVVLATYPAYSKEHLGITNTAQLQGIMAFAGIGIMAGSLLAGKLSRSHIETGLVPIGAIGILINITLITWFESPLLQILNFMLLGTMGGLFIIPLNALMQYHAPKAQLGRVLATYNLISNLMMLGFLILTILLAQAGVNSLHLFGFLTLVALGTAVYTVYKLPQSLLRFIISRLFQARYRLSVLGFEHLPPGGGVLLVGNHISWIDWAIVQMVLPRQVHFVLEQGYYEQWSLKLALKLFDINPILDDNRPASLEKINQLLRQGEVVCLFPEGHLSRTGQLTRFRDNYRSAIEDTDACLIPFYLHGLWGSRFSHSSGFLRQIRQSGFTTDVMVAFGPALPANISPAQLKQKVFELSCTAWEAWSWHMPLVPLNWLRVAKRRGFHMGVTDALGDPLSNNRFITAVIRFSALMRQSNPEQHVGLLLPTSTASAIT
ncbi:MAG: MFS transporter, partial [Thiothrix sp.]|nr:MFS transporter [Thiothrix sp.]